MKMKIMGLDAFMYAIQLMNYIHTYVLVTIFFCICTYTYVPICM
jgi:hypothetical protein